MNEKMDGEGKNARTDRQTDGWMDGVNGCFINSCNVPPLGHQNK